MDIEKIIGDYKSFYQTIISNLNNLHISVNEYEISHLGYKTSTSETYSQICKKLKLESKLYFENFHNERLISKFILRSPLELSYGISVSLIEVMPPKPNRSYSDGLEHIGIVIGDKFDEFIKLNQSLITGIQDQGPYCQPRYIRFNDKTRVKFYRYSLQKVIELEGHKFIGIK